MSMRDEKKVIQGRVLIVDDDPHVRKMLHLALLQGGYDVREAEDGEQAIEVIQHTKVEQMIDVIICDLQMPKMGGQEVIPFFRSQFPTIPIIVVTGFPDVQSATALFKQGVVDYLVKPVEAGTLVEAVRRAIGEQAMLG
jgi:two-component system, chemotaxis family, chemotaxis protein CheY